MKALCELTTTAPNGTNGRVAAQARRAGAVLALELLFVVPIMFGLAMAVIQFSLVWAGNNRVTAAAQAGARAASMPGATEQSVCGAIEQALGSQVFVDNYTKRIEPDVNVPPGEPVWVEVKVPMAVASPNLLGILGFGFGDRQLVAQSVMRKQN